MEGPTILRLSVDRFRRLLQAETDSAKRQTALKSIRETEAKLQQNRSSPLSQTGGYLR